MRIVNEYDRLVIFRFGRTGPDLMKGPGIVLLSSLAIASVYGVIRNSAWSFLGAWFFAIFAPSSSFMPIQDAIDLARYLVETAIGFTKFSIVKQPKTVGGPIVIAAITKHEGFRWIQRKHFYPKELND